LYELAGAVEVCGLSEIDAEAEILRLENSALNGIEPRIPGIHSVPIQLSNGNQVIVMRIRKSWAQPHMVTFKGSSRFFSRGSAGKHQLDVQEIRSAFLLSENVAERIRNFRLERVGKILAGETPLRMDDGGRLHPRLSNSSSARSSPLITSSESLRRSRPETCGESQSN
jgi:hypothetical protein